MQRIEENKLEMFNSVAAVLNKNKTAVDTLPALAEAKTEFRPTNFWKVNRSTPCSEYLNLFFYIIHYHITSQSCF